MLGPDTRSRARRYPPLRQLQRAPPSSKRAKARRDTSTVVQPRQALGRCDDEARSVHQQDQQDG